MVMKDADGCDVKLTQMMLRRMKPYRQQKGVAK